MDESTKLKYELKKQLARLRVLKGSGTELISVYIPSKQAVHEMSNKLREESGQATNIKSKSTRKNVGDALERIIHHLKTYGNIAPPSGVAIFCGNVSDNPAKTDIELFTIYPPEPITIQLYRCDSRFFLEPLERILAITDSYGIVVLDGRECTLAELRGTVLRILHRLNSTAHAKIRKGGQCLAPDTIVQAADGTLLPVSQVVAGTVIKGANLTNLKIGDWRCSDRFYTKARKAYRITCYTPEMEIVATAWHRFFTICEEGIREIYAKDLKIDDKVLVARKVMQIGEVSESLSADIGIARVAEKIPINDEREYVDLTVPNAFNFVANGFIVHNSARRYERLIEESIELYYKRVGEAMDRYFVNTVKGVVIGGPGPTKDNFVKMSPFNYQIKVLGVVDTGYTDEYGVREVMAKATDILAEQASIKERVVVERFIREVVAGGLATYGESEVRKAMETKQASTLLVSEGLTYKRAKLTDTTTGESQYITSKSPFDLQERIKAIGGTVKVESEQPLIDDLIDLAEKQGIEVVVISPDTAEGAQFLGSFYGIGAFLRYR